MNEKERATEVLLEVAERNGFDLEDEDELSNAGQIVFEEFPEFGKLSFAELKDIRDSSQ